MFFYAAQTLKCAPVVLTLDVRLNIETWKPNRQELDSPLTRLLLFLYLHLEKRYWSLKVSFLTWLSVCSRCLKLALWWCRLDIRCFNHSQVTVAQEGVENAGEAFSLYTLTQIPILSCFIPQFFSSSRKVYCYNQVTGLAWRSLISPTMTSGPTTFSALHLPC